MYRKETEGAGRGSGALKGPSGEWEGIVRPAQIGELTARYELRHQMSACERVLSLPVMWNRWSLNAAPGRRARGDPELSVTMN